MVFYLNQSAIQHDLETLARTDPDIAQALARVGIPEERRRPTTFDTLLRIMSGQQLSVKAAASIHARLVEKIGEPTPQDFLGLDDEQLRAIGFSRQKALYGRALADAVIAGRLNLDRLESLSDDAAVAAITQVKGFGVWSAHMFVMFSLGRGDIWPTGDLAVRKGSARIVGHDHAADGWPDEKLCAAWGKRWAGARSAVALLCWRYYSNVPL